MDQTKELEIGSIEQKESSGKLVEGSSFGN